jgi:hypothetical protein
MTKKRRIDIDKGKQQKKKPRKDDRLLSNSEEKHSTNKDELVFGIEKKQKLHSNIP